jgi:molybdopterin-guanine dinucleotide biosynthesis protein B
VEGYKREPIPKIEVRRLEASQTDGMASSDPHIIAVVSDHPTEGSGRPIFDINDVAGLANFIIDWLHARMLKS